MSRPESYREPARMRCAASLEATLRDEGSRRAAALGSVAAAAGVSALAIGQVDLWAIAGAGAIAAAAHLVRAVRARKRSEALARFFGTSEVIVAPGSWTSPDGSRRVRAVLGDALLRWEHLDPSTGETLRSYRAQAPIALPPPIAPVVFEVQVAMVNGRAREVRCFEGLPSVFGGRSLRAEDASWVFVELRRDAVVIERRDARGRPVGDTLHPDRASALRQLASELGSAMGPLREASEAARIEHAPTRLGWDGTTGSSLAL